MVGERGVRTGQYVHAGTQVISVVPLGNVWVIANYKETQLTHVAIGQRAEIRIEAAESRDHDRETRREQRSEESDAPDSPDTPDTPDEN